MIGSNVGNDRRTIGGRSPPIVRPCRSTRYAAWPRSRDGLTRRRKTKYQMAISAARKNTPKENGCAAAHHRPSSPRIIGCSAPTQFSAPSRSKTVATYVTTPKRTATPATGGCIPRVLGAWLSCGITLEATGAQHLRQSRLLLLRVRVDRPVRHLPASRQTTKGTAKLRWRIQALAAEASCPNRSRKIHVRCHGRRVRSDSPLHRLQLCSQ